MFKLCYSSTSPYVRKVSASVIECGLDNQVENKPVNPWAPDTDLPQLNPLGKVPALTLENGQTLFDSPVICEYLDSINGQHKLYPSSGKERWVAVRLQAIADGILDAAVGRILEGRRPQEQRSQSVSDRYRVAVTRSLDVLEQEVGKFADDFTIGQLSVAVALGYLDFRFASEDWRIGRTALSKWFESVSSRPSLARTVPHE